MLISEEYREQNIEAHKQPDWGTTAHYYSNLVRGLSREVGAETILDYGAGKQTLKGACPELPITSYDPAIPEISDAPEPCDLVCCIDVLEHIEPECLDAVLDDLQRVTNKLGFFIISTVPAIKKLPDGRNAHLIVEKEHFWLPKLLDRFSIGMMRNEEKAITVMVTKKA